MKAAVASLPLCDWLLKKPAWLDHQTAVGLTFAVKTLASMIRSKVGCTRAPRRFELAGI